MIKNYKKGFTLIELLVVIAIIGVLAAVVLAATNSARSGGDDAAIQANLASIRLQSELVYNATKCYADNMTAGACDTGAISDCVSPASIFTEKVVAKAITAAEKSSSGTASCQSSAGQLDWAVSVPLRSDPAQSWCVDSAGSAEAITGAITTHSCS